MKRGIILAFAVMFLCLQSALAEDAAVYTGQVHPDLPTLTLTVTDTGERIEKTTNRNILQVDIEAQDGGLTQTLTWESIESPAFERIAPLVRLVDLNFDGYSDLTLLAAQGARNVFHAFALWEEQAGQFRPVEQGSVWDSAQQKFSFESSQLELCNYELYPEEKRIFSSVADGYRWRTEVVYEWESRHGLAVKSIADIYDAGDGLIGETVLLYGTGLMRCWNEVYPEEWYYGQEGVERERTRAIREVTMGSASWKATWMKVANVDWVNLRKQDSKASPSLAKLNAGETVTLLVDDCGPENGWVRVWYDPGDGSGIFTYNPDDGSALLTGYIWHSFLEPVEK